ncbi:NUDIX hydrolase [Ktedonobacter sp. SOSP1-85]|uniref:(deoxy)nucleoside triphosphate pyrophosphohydrolase n=1 Tax=Ktedonobacter sp. SOSP1-85 TaxID=2778367 RepID=UPI001916C2BE|nr:(deoxy)nucleoside triphosphate pyrophosphohydrolase [Ktedonobacter sp. SOSP1-85]GHO78437.1 NUDIX hydrolase [Ktedonobacter sp. SOSP1-85]
MKTVTAAILILNDKILIARRKKGDILEDKWEFPGGKIEPGESPEQCLKREMMEEFGVEIEVKDFFCSSIFRYQHIEIELLAYRAVYVQGEFQLNAHAEIQWVTNKELMKFNFSEADIPIAQKLYEYNLR